MSHEDWIDNTYEDDVLARAEGLYQSHAISSAKKSGKHIYTAVVMDGQPYEVEIRYPMTRRQTSVCTCDEHLEKSFCLHSVAFLMLLRDERTKTVKTSKPPRSLTIQHIIDQVSCDELRHFVIQTAKSDKKLALRLKIHFARNVETEDNVLKYKKILDSLIRPYTGKNSQDSTFQDVRMAVQTLKDFLGQAGDLMAMGRYSEALQILKAAFPKALYLHRFYFFRSGETEDLIRQFHHMLRDFLHASLPKEIITDVIGFLQEISLLSYYEFTDGENNVVAISVTPHTKGWLGLWIPHLQELIKKSRDDQRAVLWALLLWIQDDVTDADRQALMILKPDQMVRLVDILHEKNKYALTAALLEGYAEKNTADTALSDRLLMAYSHTRKKKEFRELATELFFRTARVTYLTQLENYTTPAALTRMLDVIAKKTLRSFRHFEALISYYLSRQQISEVWLLLHGAGNLVWLRKYEDILYTHDARKLEDLYRHFILKGLENGKLHRHEIDNLMEGWTSKRWNAFRRNIERELGNFPKNDPV